MSDKTKFHLTIKTETEDWLKQEYPDADTLPEAARAAIGDARRFWRLADVEFSEENHEGVDQDWK